MQIFYFLSLDRATHDHFNFHPYDFSAFFKGPTTNMWYLRNQKKEEDIFEKENISYPRTGQVRCRSVTA